MAGTITHKWDGTVLTVTSDSGTSSADLKGAKGDDGARGAVGACPTLSVNGKIGEVVLSADDVGAVNKKGDTLEGNFNFGKTTYGHIWTTADGTIIKLRPIPDSNVFDISLTKDGNTKNAIRIYTDGTLQLSKSLPVASGGTGATTAAGARTNLGAASEEEAKAQRYYTAYGKIITSIGGTAEGYGVANVYIFPNNIVRVDFTAKIEVAGTVSNVYNVGINPTQLNTLNKNIPTNIETMRGGVINYIKQDGTVNTERTGYGGVAEAANNKTIWAMARVYTTAGGVGAWNDSGIGAGLMINGTCYGKLV